MFARYNFQVSLKFSLAWTKTLCWLHEKHFLYHSKAVFYPQPTLRSLFARRQRAASAAAAAAAAVAASAAASAAERPALPLACACNLTAAAASAASRASRGAAAAAAASAAAAAASTPASASPTRANDAVDDAISRPALPLTCACSCTAAAVSVIAAAAAFAAASCALRGGGEASRCESVGDGERVPTPRCPLFTPILRVSLPPRMLLQLVISPADSIALSSIAISCVGRRLR